MKLLKNKRAWKKWLIEEGLASQAGSTEEPVEYPCFAYTSCRSFSYEELNAHYLYKNKLEAMAFDLATAIKPIHCKECRKHRPRLGLNDRCDAQLRNLEYARAGVYNETS